MKAATHNGHCQACGRLQALPGASANLAKHGYIVKGWGFFNGVCYGADAPPLERDRKLADEIITRLHGDAQRNDHIAASLRSGETHPESVRTGRTIANDKPETWKYLGKWVSEYIAWDAADEYMRRRGVDERVSEHENQARQARSHIKSLERAIAEHHGKPVRERVRRPPPAPVTVGTVFIWGTQARYRVQSVPERGKAWCVPVEPEVGGRKLHASYVQLARIRAGTVK